MIELKLNGATNKQALYLIINTWKFYQFNDPCEYGMYLPDFFRDDVGVIVEEKPFKTRGLRGAAFPARFHSNDKDIIMLNSHRNVLEKNFDCGHEVVHIVFHWKENKKPFHCYDETVRANQNTFVEWQANEGSAEILVPHQVFIPIICERYDELKRMMPQDMDTEFYPEMVKMFKVPKSVIRIRLNSLQYEIAQALNGKPMSHLDYLSKKEIEKKGIRVNSLLDVQNDNYDRFMARCYV